MNQVFETDQAHLDKFLQADFFRFDWHKLVPASIQRPLATKWGSDWAEVVANAYQDQADRFYGSEERFVGIFNGRERQNRSFIRMPHLHRQKPITEEDFKKEEMFCTEFLAMSLQVILDRTSYEIAKNLDIEAGFI